MTALNKAPTRLNSIIQGQYLLTYVTERRSQYGEQFVMCRLEDSTDHLDVYVWAESGLIEQTRLLFTPVPVHATVYIRRLGTLVIGDLRAIHQISEPEIDNAARLLSVSECPTAAQPALQALARVVADLAPDALRRFVHRVLLDPRVADSILTCRASQRHHHAEPGGLLQHSVEVMQLCHAIGHGRLSAMELAITQVAALLHDIGKIRTVGAHHVRPVHYKLVRHETQTNRMLDGHLEWLRARAPHIAAGLDYTLDFLAQPRAERGHARFIGADMVAYADRISAGLANDKRLVGLLRQALPRKQLSALPVLEHQALLAEPPTLRLQ